MAIDDSLETIIVTKDALEQSNSVYAQGGIAGVLDPDDNVSNHFADTISAGQGLCHPEIVRDVVSEAPDRIRELIAYGTQFDRENGHLALTQEGGHSHRRVAHALGDATGKEVMRAIIDRIRQKPHRQVWEQTFTIDLLTYEGRCRGAMVWNPKHGRTCIWAKSTVLATGGAGQLYRESTNPGIATADGHAIAFRAGVDLRDMEFMQFHPTVLYIAGGARHLISEAVRGEGAYLRDRTGRRFMEDFDTRLELAPRDVVSRAITEQMSRTSHSCVYLELTHLPREIIQTRFPHIRKVCAEFGIDITREQIPVRPGAHYMIGGVAIDENAMSSLPGLWAAGEVTSSGLHGANRLGSNSLLEGLVFGLRAGEGASHAALSEPDTFTALSVSVDWTDSPQPKGEQLNLGDVRNSLGSLMWRSAGIRRDNAGLTQAAEQVDFWNRYVSTREFNRPEGWELQNLLLVSRLLIAAAIRREESRGVHYRSDFPEINPDMAGHVVLTSVAT